MTAISTSAADRRTTADRAAKKRGWPYFKLFALLLKDGLVANEIFTRAAALAYNTLFSLLPTFVLALMVVSILSAHSSGTDSTSMGSEVQTWFLHQSGLEQIEVTSYHEGKAEPINISRFLSGRIEKIRDIVQSPGAGIIGFAALLYGALNLMYVIEMAFSHVYRAASRRQWTRRLTLYWCVLTLGPLGVAGSIALSQFLQRFAGNMIPSQQWIMVPASFVLGFLISWLLVFLMYKLIPQAAVAWRSALVGSFVGALLWELGKFGFGIYIHLFVGAQKWYGNLGLIPLFMLWIYLTWNFVLIGLQVAYTHQFYNALARQFSFRKNSVAGVTDLRWVLPFAVLVYRRFKVGKSVSLDDVCVDLGMPADVGEYLTRALIHSHILHRVDDADKNLTLARPPEQITAADLLAAARSECVAAHVEEDDENYSPGIVELQQREAQLHDNRTLPMLAGTE